ncbi:hypothetical protein QUA46_25810, partial [Microcoleus sp. MON2_D6]|uniref:hypothetical protein n=1 Tax=Microcoleus sp. MON2_D6 TaxID=3055377 RepID=UPI002FD57A27
NQVNAGICRGCILPAFTGKYPANACKYLPNYCFFGLSVHWFVEVDYGCSLLVASNGFVITNLSFMCRQTIFPPH